jgi:hypothetical protein
MFLSSFTINLFSTVNYVPKLQVKCNEKEPDGYSKELTHGLCIEKRSHQPFCVRTQAHSTEFWIRNFLQGWVSALRRFRNIFWKGSWVMKEGGDYVSVSNITQLRLTEIQIKLLLLK